MTKKKTVSLFLCLSLLVTMAPTAVFATETEPSAEATQGTQESATQTDVKVQAEPETPAAQAPSQPSAIENRQTSPSGETEFTAPSQDQAIDQEQAIDETSAGPDPVMDSEPSEPSQALKETKAEAESTTPDRQAALPKEETQKESKAAADKETVTAEKTASGIRVTGGVEGKDWVYNSADKTLTINKNGMAVSGTATDNLVILCSLAVSALTLDNLDHGKNMVEIVCGENEAVKKDLTLTLKGTNKIDAITGTGDVTIEGTKNSKLSLTAGVNAFQDLNIKNAVVTGGIFSADRDINITGTSKVTAKPTKELKPALDLGLPVAMMTAGNNINIDLAPGGSVVAAGSKIGDAEVLPMLAMGHINISKNSRVLIPQNGKVSTSELFDILPVQIITDQSGNPALDVSIGHISAWNTANSGTAAATAAFGSASPQTGDDSTAGLLILYLILAASGSIALALRANKRQQEWISNGFAK